MIDVTELRDAWRFVSLSDISLPVRSCRPTEAGLEEFDYIDISSIDRDMNRISQPKRCAASDAPSRARQHVEAGDILFSTVRTYLRNIAMVDGRYHSQVASTGFCVIRVHRDLEPRFYFYFVLTNRFIGPLNELQRGTSYPAVRDSDVLSQTVPLPSLVEQRAIVAKIEQLFSELEKGVEQLQTVKQQLKQYRQAVLKAAFEGKLTAEWRAEQQAAGDLPGADELLEQIEKEREKRYQQQLQEWKREVAHWEAVEGSNSALKRPKKPASKGQCVPLSAEETASLPGLPRGWTWLRLGQIIASGIQNGLYKPQSAYGAGIPIVRINDFQNGWIRPVGELLQVRVSEEEHSLYSLHRGDVLINRVNSITHLGKCMLVPQSYESTIFESNIMRFSLLESAHAEFLCYYLQSRRGRDRLISNAKWAVNQASINQSDVASTPVPFPSLDEQRLVINEIQRRFSILDELERAVDHGLQHAEGLRQSILKKAFEGRLLSDAELAAVRNDPEYEPADKLLERIRAEKEKDKQSLRSSRAGSMRRETRRGSLRRPQEETNETASEAR